MGAAVVAAADHVPYALDDHGIAPPHLRFAGSLWGGILAAAPTRGADPATQLGKGEPALFTVHGDADRVDVECHRIEGGGHGYVGSRFFTERVAGTRTPFDRFLAFARRQLR